MYKDFHVKYPLFLAFFKSSLNFLVRFSKNTHISNFMKVRPVEAELFHADRQTDVTKITTAFSDSADAPKNCKVH